MITSDFMVYWRYSPEHIARSKEADTIEEAKAFRELLQLAGYQVKIEVRGNDY